MHTTWPWQQQELVKEALGTNQELVDEAVATMASERSRDKGVKVSADGQITMTDWAEQVVNSGQWRAHHTTNARLPSDAERTRTLHESGEENHWSTDQIDKRNCWILKEMEWEPPGRCVPTHVKNWLSSVQWRTATQLRLGLWSDDDDLRWRHTNRSNETCDRPAGRGPQQCTGLQEPTPPESSFITHYAEPYMNSCGDWEPEWRTTVW